MKRTILASSVAALGLVAAASADITGELVAASADASVFAVRSGETLNITVGDELFAGDRLITSGEGSVTVAFEGCSVDLPVSNTVVLNEEFCDDQSVGLGADLIGAEQNLGLGTGGLIAIVVGAAAVTGIIIAATDDDDEPVSP